MIKSADNWITTEDGKRRRKTEIARDAARAERAAEDQSIAALQDPKMLHAEIRRLESLIALQQQTIDRIPKHLFFLDQQALDAVIRAGVEKTVPDPFLSLDQNAVAAQTDNVVHVDLANRGGRAYIGPSGGWQTAEDVDSSPTCYADEIWDHTGEHKIISLNASQLWNDAGDIMLDWQAEAGETVRIGTSGDNKTLEVSGWIRVKSQSIDIQDGQLNIENGQITVGLDIYSPEEISYTDGSGNPQTMKVFVLQ